MTVTTTSSTDVAPVEMVTCNIDGVDISVPKGTLIIRAAELMGIEIPRFCDHPLLSPVAACRMCLVEIEGMAKPQPACAVTVGDKMVVKTQLTSEVADLAQRGVMEFLLINHPLDCPVCDKGGECPLQNQAMTHGHGETRFHGVKRTFPKPIPVSTQILLDRERCVSCARCTRFADEIAGDPFIELLERGAKQQVGIGPDAPFDSYFSGNTVQICPVGALTSAEYRFRARPFDLVSTPSACEHCASGCALRTDTRREKVMRRLAWDDPEVNEEWNCDKGRFAFQYMDKERLRFPLINDSGEGLRTASWPEAIAFAAEKLEAARGRVGVLPGGRMTREDAYAYSKFARVAAGSDDVDFRSRVTSAEETALLTAVIAGSGRSATYSELEKSPMVLLVGLEPEEESPIIFLRLRKGMQAGSCSVAAISSWASPGFSKIGGTVMAAVPGGEAQVLDALRGQLEGLSAAGQNVAAKLREQGAIILIGERLATSTGAISAALALAGETGAQLAWVPRRAGERGAVEAGLLPGVLPGGRPASDSAARSEISNAWGLGADDLPSEPGLTLTEIVEVLNTPIEEPEEGEELPESRIAGLVVGGVEITDMPNPEAFRTALTEADFVISLETRLSDVAANADVVFPVAVDTEKAGSYADWEGRIRPFTKIIKDSTQLSDSRVLAMIAEEMGRSIGYGDTASMRRELDGLGSHSGSRPEYPSVSSQVQTAPAPGSGSALLASWRHLLDLGVLQQGEPYLAGTRRLPVARMSAATAAAIGAADGEDVSVSSGDGTISLPLMVTDMPDGVVWVPGNSPGSTVNETLRVPPGSVVQIAKASGELRGAS